VDPLPANAAGRALRDAVAWLPAADRPAYRAAGTLARVTARTGLSGPGLYAVFFGARLYHGLADVLERRLQAHARAAARLGFALGGHRVFVAPMTRPPAVLRAIEKAINRRLLERHRARVTNQRAERQAQRLASLPPMPPMPEESAMHAFACQCPQCRSAGKLPQLEFAFEGADESGFEYERAYDEAEEYELAMELLSVSSEEELDRFLGKLVRGAWKGLKKVGRFVGRVAKPLGGVLRGVAKAALPFVGGALGSFIPIPGVGTMIGRAVGQAVSSALEAEVIGLEGEAQDIERARRFVRIATSAAQQAARTAASGDPQRVAQQAVLEAARRHLPKMARARPAYGATGATGATGRWRRRPDRSIVLFGA
jgi:hypothetical protein